MNKMTRILSGIGLAKELGGIEVKQVLGVGRVVNLEFVSAREYQEGIRDTARRVFPAYIGRRREILSPKYVDKIYTR